MYSFDNHNQEMIKIQQTAHCIAKFILYIRNQVCLLNRCELTFIGNTICMQTFKGCNFWDFCSQLTICETLILKILLACINWRAGYMWMTTLDTCKGWWQVLTLPATATKVFLKVVDMHICYYVEAFNPFCMVVVVDYDISCSRG